MASRKGSASSPATANAVSDKQLRKLTTFLAELETNCNQALNDYYGTVVPSGDGPDLLGLDAPGNVEATIERLAQMIVCTVGKIDKRFSSKFLLLTGSTYEHYKINQPDEYDYMVRLDLLSSPSLYKENPPIALQVEENHLSPDGFSRIKVNDPGSLSDWEEFISDEGYLLPEKIKQHFFNLVRQAVRDPPIPSQEPTQLLLPAPGPNATPSLMSVHLDTDERWHAGLSGKLVDVGVLTDILHLDQKEQFFIGIADAPNDVYPNPREFSIRMNENGPAVTLDITIPESTALPGGKKVSMDLTLGIGFDGWPKTCDFPGRVSHSHVDSLHFHRVASKGYYLVPTGPHTEVQCDQPQLLWRLSHSPAEMELMTHYSHTSVPAMILRIVKIIIGLLSKPEQFTGMNALFTNFAPDQDSPKVRVVSSYVLKTLFLQELERYLDVQDWISTQIGERVLSILSALVEALKEGKLRSYFNSGYNILLRKEFTLDDCISDANVLEQFIQKLQEHISSAADTSPSMETSKFVKCMESELQVIDLWNALLWQSEVKERRGSKSQRSLEKLSFTPIQMRYLDALFCIIDHHYSSRGVSGSLFNGLTWSAEQHEDKSLNTVLKSLKEGDPNVADGVMRVLRVLEVIFHNLTSYDDIIHMKGDANTVAPCMHAVTPKMVFKSLAEQISTAPLKEDWAREKLGGRVVGTLTGIIGSLRKHQKQIMPFHTGSKWRPSADDYKHDLEMLTNYVHSLQKPSLHNGLCMAQVHRRWNSSELQGARAFCRRVSSRKEDPQPVLEEAANKGHRWAR